MTLFAQYRKQFHREVGKLALQNENNQTTFNGGYAARYNGMYSETLEVQERTPFQCLDPSSPNFGKVFYIAGLHVLGDPNHPVGPDCG